MAAVTNNINEQLVTKAFDKQSALFDELYSHDTIIQYKRERVRTHVNQLLRPASSILELNAGTGEDTIYFAMQGHHVHATDISAGMQQALGKKIKHLGLNDKVSLELCSFTSLNELKNNGPYDFIFSNFAGLNCTENLETTLHSFSKLLKSGGAVTMVLLPSFCLWETLLMFKGKFKTAFRRFFAGRGSPSHIEGVYFRCWYYDPSYIVQALKKSFDLVSIEGLCTIVPPSYIKGFAEKHPGMYAFLKKKEDKWKALWPWKYIGDYYIISLIKKD
jgi:ubiquinone/menaquinone biosynthesis C-methylase UbiE